MKKIILLIGLFCVVMTVAQNKIYFYFEGGASESYDLSGVDSISFVSPSSLIWKDGKLPGKFSVSATKQVQFSQGNLQYQASTDTWRFAENQYDALGKEANEQISATNTGWIDLFGWGTSGYNGKYPYTSGKSEDYGDGKNDIAGTNYDWGVYNKISNGGNVAGKWRTLTKSEWEYIFKGRTNAGYLCSLATVCGVNGYLLLPDGFECPNGIKFFPKSGSFTANNYSENQWRGIEAAGAVFLPCAGIDSGSGVNLVGSDGYYWSSSAYRSYYADVVHFDSGLHYAYKDGHDGRANRLSVRLATE